MLDDDGASILRGLKEQTADLHVEAERHVRILDADATDATYTRYLARMFGFHAAVEERFAASDVLAHAGFDAALRRKRSLLAGDLRALGVDGDELPICELPVFAGVEIVGAAYVVEGSTLGGRFILSRMRPRFGHLIGVATAFLDGYGSRTGERWRAFRAVAARALVGDRALAMAVRGARRTFEHLIAWLDEQRIEPPQPFKARRREQVVR